VPRPITVWLVPLQQGATAEIKGELSLSESTLDFLGVEGTARRIEVSSITQVKRVLGSPIVIVRHEHDGSLLRTAFYFTQPPSLEGHTTGAMPRRRARRVAVNYLGQENRDRKADVQKWVREIRAAIERPG
jgi:hypothetical protein